MSREGLPTAEMLPAQRALGRGRKEAQGSHPRDWVGRGSAVLIKNTREKRERLCLEVVMATSLL